MRVRLSGGCLDGDTRQDRWRGTELVVPFQCVNGAIRYDTYRIRWLSPCGENALAVCVDQTFRNDEFLRGYDWWVNNYVTDLYERPTDI